MELSGSANLEALRQQLALLTAEVRASEQHGRRLHAAYEQRAAVLAALGEGITVLDATGTMVYANPAAARLLGYPHPAALLAVPPAQIMARFRVVDADGQPFDVARSPTRLALQGIEPPPTIMGFQGAGDDAWHWSSVSARAVLDATGKVQEVVTIWRDITALKHSELVLRAEREHLAVTLDSIGDGVIVTDPAGSITLLNPVAAHLTGWTAEAAQGQPVRAVFRTTTHAIWPIVPSPVQHALHEGTVEGFADHTLLLTRDGGERPITTSGAPIHAADGTRLGSVLVFRDVSAQHAAHDALQASEARFRLLANAAPVLIWQADTTGGYIFLNAPWLRFTGRTMEQELGDGWADRVHPDDLERCLLTYRTAFAAREPFQMPYRLQRNDGVYRWLLDTATPLWDGPTFAGFIGSCMDITEQHERQEDQQFLNEISAVLSSSLDYHTTLRAVAERSVPVLGDWCGVDVADAHGTLQRLAVAHTDPAKLHLAHDLLARYPPDTQSISRQVFQTGHAFLLPVITDAMLVATARDEGHLRLLRAIGFRSLLVVPLLVRERSLGVLMLVMAESGRQYSPLRMELAQAIAHRAALALENAHLYQAAQHAITLRNQFLALAAHEVNTPLTNVVGSAQLLLRKFADSDVVTERMRRRIQILLDQGQRLQRVISAVFDLRLIEDGTLELDLGTVDLRHVIEVLVAEVQPNLLQHTIHWETPPTPLLVRGDAVRLEHIFHHLLQNALKYSPDGGVVRITLSITEQTVCCHVQDQGIGIPPEDVPHIFERFYRASNINRRQFSGMGIGLYVAQALVRLHGGTLRATSSGSGSTFTVCIPRLVG